MTDSVAEKVRSYENFLNDKLRVDLRCGMRTRGAGCCGMYEDHRED